ncbi:unnamed protein product [Linum trigynum]|uniref:Endonuclease/exonuclease/phosphatase domain-containing protein n=1 Tax=Linum trigynum TaxID=586398 RepID=A0AAV2FUE6_9ROSI
MTQFNDCLNDIGCHDMGFLGYPFTWENRRTRGGYIEERLDRFIANEKLTYLFPNGRVQHGDRAHSDHRPIMCESMGEEDMDVKWVVYFRFDPLWAKHSDCFTAIEAAWKTSSSSDILDKIARCCNDLENCSRQAFPGFAKQKKKAYRAIRALERREKNEMNLARLRVLEDELADILDSEEKCWK